MVRALFGRKNGNGTSAAQQPTDPPGHQKSSDSSSLGDSSEGEKPAGEVTVPGGGGDWVVGDIDRIIEQLLHVKNMRPGTEVCLAEDDIFWLCKRCREIILSQPMLLEISCPVNICGDTHGQYHDLLRLFEIGQFPPHANYLFLGDYVDRAKQSIETMSLLMCYKIKYPESFFLLRGNHECASLNRIYGFYDECKRRYSVKLWRTFSDLFNCMPIAAVVEDKIFCMHGGLSPELKHLSQILQIQRPVDVPDDGLICDLLWADPDPNITGWARNPRGVSYLFGYDMVEQFLNKHDLDLVCRAHQVVEDGYEFQADRQLVTLFSAPNYCGEFDNAGAMMCVSEELVCSFRVLRPALESLSPPSARNCGSNGESGRPTT